MTSWRAGVGGARPGLIMPGDFLLGSRYFQEVAPDVALDRALHSAMNLTEVSPAGSFSGCVEVIETSPLEPGAQSTKDLLPRGRSGEGRHHQPGGLERAPLRRPAALPLAALALARLSVRGTASVDLP